MQVGQRPEALSILVIDRVVAQSISPSAWSASPGSIFRICWNERSSQVRHSSQSQLNE
jgi:hypothetical protein